LKILQAFFRRIVIVNKLQTLYNEYIEIEHSVSIIQASIKRHFTMTKNNKY